MPAKVLIGTSGFGYSDWQARQEKTEMPFYPANLNPSYRLSFYSEIFPIVEINTSFYSFPRLASVKKWYNYVPSAFRFAFKIPKLITHEKKLDVGTNYLDDLQRFLNIIQDGFQTKMGPALLQLPPKFSDKYFNRLEVFLKYWPQSVRLAIEFRDMSWIERIRFDQTLELLSTYSVAFCVVDEPLLPSVTPITTDFMYIRFHGHGLKPWYNYTYSMRELTPWASKIKEISKTTEIKEVFTFFNNHSRGSAPANAQQLAKLLHLNLRSPESINLIDVRKRVGDIPQHSLTTFLDIPSVDVNEYVRFCSQCGEMILKDDNFCEICGFKVERE